MRLRIPASFRLTKSLTLTISVLIALILWALLKLKDDYQTTFVLPCKIVNLPAGVQLKSAALPSIRFRVTGAGNALLAASMPWNQDTLTLNYDNAFKKGWFEPNNHLTSFQHLPNNIKLDGVIEDSVYLHFVANTSKKVPIISQIKIVLPKNYHLFTQPEFKPDSIILYGDATLLRNINAWKTIAYTLSDINQMRVFDVPLEKKEGIVCERSIISVKISPEAFTEIELSIPIQTTDVPPLVEVIFQPPILSPRCIIPFTDYEKLQQGHFSYLIPYDSLQNKSSFVPNYSFLPKNVQVSPISIQEVNYTIRTIKN